MPIKSLLHWPEAVIADDNKRCFLLQTRFAYRCAQGAETVIDLFQAPQCFRRVRPIRVLFVI